jgi:hypothetical protein
MHTICIYKSISQHTIYSSALKYTHLTLRLTTRSKRSRMACLSIYSGVTGSMGLEAGWTSVCSSSLYY